MADDPVPTPDPSLQRPPVGAPGGPPIPTTVPVTTEEYHRLRNLEIEMAKLQAKADFEKAQLEEKRISDLAKEKGYQAALEEQRKAWETKLAEQQKQTQEYENQLLGKAVETSVVSHFTGLNFVGDTPEEQQDAASLLLEQISKNLVATREGGSIVVREKGTGRLAVDVVKEKLSKKLYARFLAPSTQGGTGSDGTRPPPTPNSGPQPGSVQAIAQDWKARQSGQNSNNPIYTSAKPQGFGLRRA